MIHVLIGDILQSKAHAVVNTVNCVGFMGKGIAAEFKKKFPEMFEDYKKLCDAKQVKPGKPYIYYDKSGVVIINFPTKDHWRSPSRLEDIILGLDFLLKHIDSWHIKSLAVPPLGCGNGGLEWTIVGPIIYQKLENLSMPIEIYAPYGTPSSQMDVAFFKQKITIESLNGKEQQKINPAWLVLLEVIDRLSKQPYANPVGRTIFQKIAYILTEQGVNTGFEFNQGSYGPFSTNMKEALKVFTNSNLIKEQMLGRMMAMQVGSNYSDVKNKYQDTMASYSKQIEKTVDLFTRIKSTEQAEEVTTVLFTAKKLKQDKKSKNISEQEVFDFIIKWKKTWDTADKRKAIAETIRNLEMLRWVTLEYSDSLPFDDLEECDLP